MEIDQNLSDSANSFKMFKVPDSFYKKLSMFFKKYNSDFNMLWNLYHHFTYQIYLLSVSQISKVIILSFCSQEEHFSVS